jgi:hypothetical protein
MEQMVSIVYSGLNPKKHFPADKLSFAFFDKDGKQYYTCKELPIIRKVHVANAYIRLVNSINEQDITISLSAIVAAIEETDAKGKMQPNIARVAYICKKLLSRKGFYVNESLLHELMACYFIREDEAFDMVDEKIVAQKIEAIKGLDYEVVKEFFYSQSINELFPYLQDGNRLLNDVLKETAFETKSFIEELNRYINGRSNISKV